MNDKRKREHDQRVRAAYEIANNSLEMLTMMVNEECQDGTEFTARAMMMKLRDEHGPIFRLLDKPASDLRQTLLLLEVGRELLRGRSPYPNHYEKFLAIERRIEWGTGGDDEVIHWLDPAGIPVDSKPFSCIVHLHFNNGHEVIRDAFYEDGVFKYVDPTKEGFFGEFENEEVLAYAEMPKRRHIEYRNI